MPEHHDRTPAGDVTLLLHDASGGDRAAYDRLFALAHAELQAVAERQLRRGGPRLTLDPAELVSELYLKLRDQLRIDWAGRAHFYAVAARAMRQILVDLARRQQAAKRGGGDWHPTTLSGKALAADVTLDDVLALDAVLAQLDDRQRRLVELRFFAGASEQEIAELLGMSTRTVQREWAKARARLYHALYGNDDGPV
jgi:RNA polymerase sigma factor (TIGR02999 family)